MREIAYENIVSTVRELCIKAATVLPDDLCRLLDKARDTEKSPAGKSAMEDIVANYEFAAEAELPICQDTGMAVVFCNLGQDAHISGGLLSDAVNEGVRQGYVTLRKSVVADPLRRVNTGDNTPAVIHIQLVEGESLEINVAPKGFGSENMSKMKMFLPSCKREDIERFIAECISVAGSNPCPPVVVGVGLGGTVEKAALLAKTALARPVGERNPDPFYAKMEESTLKRINATGVGPQGFGGINTAVAVNIETYPTHIAGLPCVVNVGCHVTRHASATI
ncbi:MAG: fumarate hydratase [Ruminococcaceae bacterium]|nr:fumarate hydratase [Oscillospiraceae bacterium]